MLNAITRTFFNAWYRLFPPPMVSYWKRGDKARAKVIRREDGSFGMMIEGEKEIMPGFPRGHVLTGKLAEMKKAIKDSVFNAAFAQIERMAEDAKYDMMPPERMAPAVRHVWETFERMKEVEIVPDMKGRMALIQKVICHFIQEDDAYRFRAQLFLDMIDQRKIRLSKADAYYFRGKYAKPDRFKKVLGKWVDGYQY
jgi:hypothetical protein